jgi:putative aldouronate transport system permease protein
MSTLAKKKSRIQEGNPIATVLIYVVCILAGLICVYPMYYVLCMSLSSTYAVEARKVFFYPIDVTFQAYKVIFLKTDLWRAYGNTIIYLIGSVLGQLIFCLLAAYPLTVKSMIGRKYITTFFLIPMYFGAGLIPTFLTYKGYGFVNNPIVMIVTHCHSIWYMILCRTYLLSIPDALRDSAKIDGANHFRTLFQIFMPLAKPIIAVLAIYTFVSVWNSWSTANIYIRDKSLQPLQLFLRRMLKKADEAMSATNPKEQAALEEMRLVAMSLQYAMIIFTTLPVLVVYPFFQKYFVKGVMVGSVKG